MVIYESLKQIQSLFILIFTQVNGKLNAIHERQPKVMAPEEFVYHQMLYALFKKTLKVFDSQ